MFLKFGRVGNSVLTLRHPLAETAGPWKVNAC